MKRSVVTGGAGFIGSHLAQELVRRGYHVIILDDLSTGKIKNLKPLLDKPKVEFIQGSITDLPLLHKLFRDADYIFHQAALSSIPRSVKNPAASHEVNITGTLNVLLAARDNNIKKVIYASSSSVYRDSPVLPRKEDMPLGPRSPYAITKVAGEHYCRVFQEIYGLPTARLRYFNVYGPRQDPNSDYAAVIPRFIKRLLEGNPPIIFGDGHQTRDFTFIADAIAANILACESNATGAFNVGASVSITISELANLTIKLMGSTVDPIYQAPRPGDTRRSLADISKARAFRYKPRYSLEEGLVQTIDWFSNEQ